MISIFHTVKQKRIKVMINKIVNICFCILAICVAILALIGTFLIIKDLI